MDFSTRLWTLHYGMRADQEVPLTGVYRSIMEERKGIKCLGEAGSFCSYASREECLL